MDKNPSPHFIGDAEGCSSSESGWTMYLASSMHGDSSNGDDDDEEGDVGNGYIGEGKEDDDSMASDASSGTPCKKLVDYAICHVKHGDVCCEGVDGVVKEKSGNFSSRHSRKNVKEEKGMLSETSVEKEEKGDSISIHGSIKMRRVKSSEK